MLKFTKLADSDLAENNSAANCMKNTKHKIKNGIVLSKENLQHLATPDITGAKIEKRDFMQWALMKNSLGNVKILSNYFYILDYEEFLKNLSKDIQDNMNPFFEAERNKLTAKKK